MDELTVTQRVERALHELAQLDAQQREEQAPWLVHLDDLDAQRNFILGEMHAASAETAQHIAQVEALLRDLGVQVGKTVKDTQTGYQVVYVGAKRKWDGDKLEGFGAARPEVYQCSTLGQPGVQIRRK